MSADTFHSNTQNGAATSALKTAAVHPKGAPAIKLDALTKHYGRSRGIEQLSLTVNAGEFFGFIGPNGAGKSTTIRTLLGLIAPTSGTASLFGLDIRKEKEQILVKTGYLPSEAIFYSGMRVRDVLQFSANLRKTDCKETAQTLCERLQLDSSRKVNELSFGNRKKVGIVCALQHKPELLILDEPTSGLDPLMQKEFFSILKEQNAAGTTIFLSSHILSEIEQHCSRAAIIREGRLIACDTIDALAKTNTKRIALRGAVDLNTLDGIRDKKVENELISFLYNGNLDALLQTLASGSVTDLTVTEPDLEEVFLHYYEKEEPHI